MVTTIWFYILSSHLADCETPSIKVSCTTFFCSLRTTVLWHTLQAVSMRKHSVKIERASGPYLIVSRVLRNFHITVVCWRLSSRCEARRLIRVSPAKSDNFKYVEGTESVDGRNLSLLDSLQRWLGTSTIDSGVKPWPGFGSKIPRRSATLGTGDPLCLLGRSAPVTWALTLFIARLPCQTQQFTAR